MSLGDGSSPRKRRRKGRKKSAWRRFGIKIQVDENWERRGRISGSGKEAGRSSRGGQDEGTVRVRSFALTQDERARKKVIGSMRGTLGAFAARTFSAGNIRLPYVDGIFEKSERPRR